MDSGEGWVKESMGGTSRGVMCWQWLLAVVLVCIGMLVKTEEADPIYVAVGICLGCG